MEASLGKNGHLYMVGWVPLLSTWNYHNMLIGYACVCAKSLNPVRLFVTPWTVACQAPLSVGFSRQDTGVGCYSILQGIFPTRDQTSISFVSCIFRQVLYHWHHREAKYKIKVLFFKKVPENAFLVSYFYSNSGLEILTTSFSASPTQRRCLLPSAWIKAGLDSCFGQWNV